MVKKSNEFTNILSPKLALKISPNFTKDLSKNEGNRLDVNNVLILIDYLQMKF